VTLASLLPLAFVMIAGPQIISAVFFATSVNWKGTSAAYVLGAAISITAFVTAAYLIAKGAKDAASSKSEGADWTDAVVLVLLVAAAIYTFVKRKTSHPPKWMARLQTASPRFAFLLGLALLGVFPTDILTSVSVGTHVASKGAPWSDVIPFIVLTLLFLSTPAALVVMLGHRAQTFLPKVRDWMNTNSWIVSEIVIAFFIVIVINTIAG
jgi:hypothetical protein